MNNGGNDDIEERLRRLELKPAPRGLRERVLDAARKRREATVWTTPLLRRGLVACAAILALVFVTDTALSRKQQGRLQALLDGSPRIQDRAADESRTLAEVLGESFDRKLAARSERASAEEMRAGQVRREDVLRELLKEDFDGSESEKNHR